MNAEVPRPARRLAAALVLCVAALLAVPAVSAAAPTLDAEPNDTLLEMQGPISNDGVAGTLNSLLDVDKYLVQMKPARHIKMVFTVTNAGTPQCPLAPMGGLVHYQITTEVAEPVLAGAIPLGGKFVDVVDNTTPGEQGDPPVSLHLAFFAEGKEAVGCTYRFAITDSGGHATDAIDPTEPEPPLATVPVPEPNDLPEQAFGPLAGDTDYLGTIDSETDIDWLRAWLFPGQQVTLELTAAVADVQLSVTDPKKNILLPPLDAQLETIHRVPIVGTPALALIKIKGKIGARWRLRLTPPEAILSAAPGGTPPRAPLKPYKSGVTLRRGTGAGVRYVGTVTSAGGSGCRGGRLVVLRHAGTGLKRFSITRTRADGTFTVTRRHRTGGTVYVAVAEKVSGRRLCSFARSPRVRA
jgi:hypothetical protein